jgi:O-antigen ligase
VLSIWQKLGIINKLLGSGQANTGGGHNDYLRILINAGILGLIAYLVLLIAIGLGVMRNLTKHRNPLNLMALIIYCAWMIDTLGLTPGLYPNYQWYVWGFIGIALKGVTGLHDESRSGIANMRNDEDKHSTELINTPKNRILRYKE